MTSPDFPFEAYVVTSDLAYHVRCEKATHTFLNHNRAKVIEVTILENLWETSRAKKRQPGQIAAIWAKDIVISPVEAATRLSKVFQKNIDQIQKEIAARQTTINHYASLNPKQMITGSDQCICDITILNQAGCQCGGA